MVVSVRPGAWRAAPFLQTVGLELSRGRPAPARVSLHAEEQGPGSGVSGLEGSGSTC